MEIQIYVISGLNMKIRRANPKVMLYEVRYPGFPNSIYGRNVLHKTLDQYRWVVASREWTVVEC